MVVGLAETSHVRGEIGERVTRIFVDPSMFGDRRTSVGRRSLAGELQTQRSIARSSDRWRAGSSLDYPLDGSSIGNGRVVIIVGLLANLRHIILGCFHEPSVEILAGCLDVSDI